MFINLPTEDALKKSSLDLYFSAWSTLIEIIAQHEFLKRFASDMNLESDNSIDEEQNKEFHHKSQMSLQTVCTLIQQSTELALKSKVVAVSPYLLLSNWEQKLNASDKEYDFSEFNTVNASKLDLLVNATSSNALSNNFSKAFKELRITRNKIIHLGQAEKLNAYNLIQNLIEFYIELWPNGHWLNDRLNYEAGKLSYFVSDVCYGECTSEAAIFENLCLELEQFKPEQCLKIFQSSYQDWIYLCPQCFTFNGFGHGISEAKDCRTAIKTDNDILFCHLCLQTFKYKNIPCSDCTGNTICILDDYTICNDCGDEQVIEESD